MYRLTDDENKILRLTDNTYIYKGHPWWNEYEKWVEKGNIPQSAPTLTLTPALIQSNLVNAVQRYMDSVAVAKGYDNIFTAVTYAEEPSIPQFQNEGKAFRQWRSLVWAYCYQVLAAVQQGARSIPTTEELIAELPSAPVF